MSPPPRTIAALACPLLLLAGCSFFGVPDDPTPPGSLPAELSCGDEWNVDGLTGADAIPLDIAPQTNFLLVGDFGSEMLSMRLSRDTGSSIERSLLVWDPVSQRSLIPGTQNGEGTLQIELLGTSFVFSGTVSVECSQPEELCFDLTDNDGDGDVDCADLNCAWDSSCNDAQEVFYELEVSCDEEDLVVSTALGATDSQHTTYRTVSATESAHGLEFWGGAEVTIVAVDEDVESITIVPGAAGLLCFPDPLDSLSDETIVCESTQETMGTELTLSAEQLPVIIEPLAAGWTDLQIFPACDAR